MIWIFVQYLLEREIDAEMTYVNIQWLRSVQLTGEGQTGFPIRTLSVQLTGEGQTEFASTDAGQTEFPNTDVGQTIKTTTTNHFDTTQDRHQT